MATKHGSRSPWKDRFTEPTIDQLLAGLGAEERSLIDAARAMLGAFERIGESVQWQGVAWRWAMTFAHPGDERAWAFLIPNPERPEIAVPMTGEFLETLNFQRMRKFLRDELVHARCVRGVYWPSWELVSTTQLDELKTVIKKKHEFSAAAACSS